MKIEDHIKDHEKQRRKLNDEKERLEEKLNKINEKIIFHAVAIHNLERKQKNTVTG